MRAAFAIRPFAETLESLACLFEKLQRGLRVAAHLRSSPERELGHRAIHRPPRRKQPHRPLRISRVMLAPP
jgi:hypothetical protein